MMCALADRLNFTKALGLTRRRRRRCIVLARGRHQLGHVRDVEEQRKGRHCVDAHEEGAEVVLLTDRRRDDLHREHDHGHDRGDVEQVVGGCSCRIVRSLRYS